MLHRHDRMEAWMVLTDEIYRTGDWQMFRCLSLGFGNISQADLTTSVFVYHMAPILRFPQAGKGQAQVSSNDRVGLQVTSSFEIETDARFATQG